MKRNGGARQVLKHRPPVSCSLQQLLQRREREARGCCSPRRVRKAGGGRTPGGCGAHTGAVSPAQERFWNTSATRARPLPKTLQAKRGRLLGLRGKPKSKRRLWTPQQRLSASSEGVMLSGLRVGRPQPHAKVPVLLTTPSAREPEGSFSQAPIFHPDFTTWSPMRWKRGFL